MRHGWLDPTGHRVKSRERALHRSPGELLQFGPRRAFRLLFPCQPLVQKLHASLSHPGVLSLREEAPRVGRSGASTESRVLPTPPAAEATPGAPPAAGPVTEPERIFPLDVLRGLAVLGILVMNMRSFALPSPAYLNPHALGTLTGADWWTWLAAHFLADRKFITLFSMLFGAGILLFSERAEARGGRVGRLHYRRMGWLLLFGIAHAHLLWYGDILYSYAVCGMLLYPLRRWPPGRLLALGLGAMAFGTALFAFFAWSMDYWPAEQLAAMRDEHWRPLPEFVEREVEAYRGGWLAQMRYRAPMSFMLQTGFFLMNVIWRVSGAMLLGMALYKWGVLAARRSRAFYARWLVAGLAVGWPLILLGVHLHERAGWSMRYSMFLGWQINSWASLPVALAYASAVMLVCGRGLLPGLTARLAAVGRMAFTNYIVQTLICTTLFYGHGLGLYARLPFAQLFWLVLAIWVLQLAYSPWWLARFRFGPLEWLWRSLTYRTRQPLRRVPPQAAATPSLDSS